MTQLPSPLVLVDAERQLVVLHPDGRRIPLTRDPSIVWASWARPEPELLHLWPSFSPDGGRVAAFAHHPDGQAAPRVRLLDLDGVEDADLAFLDDRLPIYLSWDPTGQRLALLTQRRSELALSIVDPSEPGEEQVLLRGSPVFFTWAEDRLAVYVSDSPEGENARLVLLDPTGRRPPERLPGTPGNFCAPVWLGDELVYVTYEQGRTSVVRARPGAQQAQVVEQVRGLVALVAQGGWVARGVAPEGDGTPYRFLSVYELPQSRSRMMLDWPCLAFLWAGSRLVLTRVDTERNLLEWFVLQPGGAPRHIIDIYPTRDLSFYLRFFEQYSLGLPLVDPSGRYLALAGSTEADGDEQPHVLVLDLEKRGPPLDLGPGIFASWGV